MAVEVFNISGGGSSIIAAADISAAADTQTVAHSGKDHRLALRVANGNAISINVAVMAGNGPRAALGSMTVSVAANSTAYIALFDTARFKNLATGNITVNLTDGQGAALGEALASVQIEAVQM
ncbi:MAG: hypothetical protein ACM3S4_07365 [Burkholderiales bacterium]